MGVSENGDDHGSADPNSYPALADDVTADRMCRYLTRQARQHAANIEALTGTPGRSAPALLAEAAAMVALYAVVHMLRYINEAEAEDADEFARQIWDAWRDGAHMEEMLREWADEYGQLDDVKP